MPIREIVSDERWITSMILFLARRDLSGDEPGLDRQTREGILRRIYREEAQGGSNHSLAADALALLPSRFPIPEDRM